jgi:hypothetical protein
MNRITIVSVPDGDWEGLYVNGIRSYEDHKIRICHLECALPIESINFHEYEEFNSDLGGNLPLQLSDIVR